MLGVRGVYGDGVGGGVYGGAGAGDGGEGLCNTWGETP